MGHPAWRWTPSKQALPAPVCWKDLRADLWHVKDFLQRRPDFAASSQQDLDTSGHLGVNTQNMWKTMWKTCGFPEKYMIHMSGRFLTSMLVHVWILSMWFSIANQQISTTCGCFSKSICDTPTFDKAPRPYCICFNKTPTSGGRVKTPGVWGPGGYPPKIIKMAMGKWWEHDGNMIIK